MINLIHLLILCYNEILLYRKWIIMASFQPRKYLYKTGIKWIAGENGEIYSKDNPSIKIALPENLGGPGGNWSPDELFVASAEACAMLTFFWLLKDMDVDVQSYESEAEGISQIASGGIFRFTKITLKPRIIISKEEDMSKVEEAVKKLDDWCCVSNSVKAEVLIEPTIEIGNKK
jgi:peroxiredoxin-like protein